MTFADPTEHPRPQLVREHWWSLDGTWDHHADGGAELGRPADVPWAGTITVPFAPETPASGVGDPAKCRAHWYRRHLDVPALAGGDRLLLHCNAVDHAATVWVDGHRVADHEGGYTPFTADITDAVAPGGAGEIVIRAFDDPDELDKPRGKQTWRDERHGIWYDRTSGIWQTVWLERVPGSSIAGLRWTGDAARLEVGLDVHLAGPVPTGATLRVQLALGARTLVDDTVACTAERITRRFGLADTGQFDRDELLWSPHRPNLIDAELTLSAAGGETLDRVRSYTGLRSVELRDGRFWINGRVTRLRLVLDQGYWPSTGLTPPDGDALRRDLELVRALGFHGVRKHQKVEDPRFYAWADRLGVLVWSELPSAHTHSPRFARRALAEWAAIVEAHRDHPCVVAWVPVNESWGVPDVARRADQQALVRALTETARALDGTRPVVANDGWETVGGDVVAIHDYDGDAGRVRARYADRASVDALLAGTGPVGRTLVVQPPDRPDPPVLVTEYGGIGLATDGEAWGYHRAADGAELVARYAELTGALRASPVLAGWCYTQLTDTYQEANGLLTMDREPKAPLEDLRRATRGR